MNGRGGASSGIAGHRKRLVRRVTLGIAIGALALTPLGIASASPGESRTETTKNGRTACAVEKLPLPDGATGTRVWAGDPTGRFLVATHYAGQRWNSIMWKDGKVKDLTGPPDTRSPIVQDVNEDGVAVGFSHSDADQEFKAWSYSETRGYTLLPGPDDAGQVIPSAINIKGDIVGYARTDATHRPLLWPAAEPGTFRELEAPETASAVGISNDGVIIGNLRPLAQEATGYVWRDADEPGKALEAPGGHTNTRVSDINGKWIGGLDAKGGENIGLMWDIEAGTATPKPTRTTIFRVNAQGDGANEQLTSPVFHADSVIVRADGTVVELPALAEKGTTGVMALPDRDAPISAAGYATDEDGKAHPVVWRGC